MIRFILGVIVGIVLSTVGMKGVLNMMNGIAPIIDSNVGTVKSFAKNHNN